VQDTPNWFIPVNVMRKPNFQSIRSKLTLLIAAASGVALLIASISFGLTDLSALRESKVQTLSALAEVLASNMTAALSFQQADAAEDLLSALKNRPTVIYACVMEKDGSVLAQYRGENAPIKLPSPSRVKRHAFVEDGHLDVVVPVVEDAEQLGAVYLHATMDDVEAQTWRHLGIVCLIIAGCLGLAIILAYAMQHYISAPILSLASTAERISREGDYSIRVQRKSNDELGVLYEHFNRMLQHIQDGEAMLREARDQLELRVEERTQQLQEANTELQHRMQQRDQAMRQLEQSNRVVQLLQDVTAAANEAKRVETAVLSTLKNFCQYANWPVGHAYFPDHEKPGELVEADLWYDGGEPEHVELRKQHVGARFAEGDGLVGHVLASLRPQWAVESDVPDADRPPGSTSSKKWKYSFALPVLTGAEVVAVLEFFSPDGPEGCGQDFDEFFIGLPEVAQHVGNQLGRVFERQRASSILEDMHRKFLDTARQAGMAEVATGVLHNVGNVLNSINVSCGIIHDTLHKSEVSTLKKAADVVQEHMDDLGEFITKDERGRHLAPFLINLSNQIVAEEKTVLDEIDNLRKNVEHVKDIISVQQTNAKLAGFIQEASLESLIDEAIRINATAAVRHHIRIVKDCDNVPLVLVDKQKVMQILVNLISNAKNALNSSEQPNKRITFRLRRLADERICLEVEDNGIGISRENQTRVFSHGFTTREDGHGFGLHSAALFAKEMGGSLTLRSGGLGKGATFVLELPVKMCEPKAPAGYSA